MLPSKTAGEWFPCLEEFDVQVDLDSHSAPLTEEIDVQVDLDSHPAPLTEEFDVQVDLDSHSAPLPEEELNSRHHSVNH
jgi:hypothetical protein